MSAKRKTKAARSQAIVNRRHKPFLVYLTDDLVCDIDAWRAHQEGEPSRSDAIRRMVRRVLRGDASATA